LWRNQGHLLTTRNPDFGHAFTQHRRSLHIASDASILVSRSLEEWIMEKTTVGLLGAVAGLAAMGTAQAANAPAPNASEALQASSYADLLSPIPDAVALMRADDELRAQDPPAEPTGEFKLVDGYAYNPYYPQYRHHHHHHHHHHQAYYRHHHHHHHHHGAYVAVPGVGVVIGSH
jgi:ABC-type nickel/cobalt efflux system permease component RcnA